MIVITLVVLLFSAILHEIMHGFIAEKLGDPTARVMGRLTLNPIPHIDPFMSILLPGILLLSGSPIIFGAAKPVPVNPIHLQDPKKDMALVALAGPLTNIVLAVASALLFHTFSVSPLVSTILFTIVFYNLVLAIVNLIPIPPLDGSKVLGAVLPDSVARTYFSLEPFGLIILFMLFLIPIGGLSLGGLISQLVFSALTFLGIPLGVF